MTDRPYRGADADVRVQQDPVVSTANTELGRTGDGYEVRDLPASRNGTTLNWTRLETEAPTRLWPGDTVAVGRTLLVFRKGPTE